MNKTIKIISFLLCIAVLFTSCAGEIKQQTNEGEKDKVSKKDNSFILPYSRDEGFNPYMSQDKLVLQNSNLIFTKLLEIDNTFGIDYKIAKSVLSLDKAVEIFVDTSYKFEDGTAVSAGDVAASLNAAKQSAAYGARFENMLSAAAISADKVEIELNSPDSMFAYLLDIPILKQGEVGSKQPSSSGIYKISGTNLVINEQFSSADSYIVKQIELVELSGLDALVSSLNIGSISLMTSDTEGDISGNTATRQTGYRMNNLVFLGLNANRTITPIKDVDGVIIEYVDNMTEGQKFLRNTSARLAVNSLIDKKMVCERGYYSKGSAAKGIINPVYPFMQNQEEEQVQTLDEVKSAIESMGYQINVNDGFYYRDERIRLDLNLLVYSASAYKRYTAILIKEELLKAGINVNIIETDSFDTYTQKIANGDFDMYIGEVKLYNNMDMSAFFNENGAANRGIAYDENIINAYTAFKQRMANAPQFNDAFKQAMPFIPLVWRNGTVFYTKRFDGLTASISNPFYGFDKLTQ